MKNRSIKSVALLALAGFVFSLSFRTELRAAELRPGGNAQAFTSRNFQNPAVGFEVAYDTIDRNAFEFEFTAVNNKFAARGFEFGFAGVEFKFDKFAARAFEPELATFNFGSNNFDAGFQGFVDDRNV